MSTLANASKCTPALDFDAEVVGEELAALFCAADKDAIKVRPQVLDAVKPLIARARAEAEEVLSRSGSGIACAQALSDFQDRLIALLYDFTTRHIYRVENPSDAERMSVVATGGYGRGLLAPGSDIDLLFLLPYKQTAWGENVVEYMLYMLWDLGFKVGHATRTIGQCVSLSKADFTIRTALLDARLILGDQVLFSEFGQRFQSDVVRGTGREFVDAKLAERYARHKHSGRSRYVVEPNIKEEKGGLRDLHTLSWLVKYLHGQEPDESAVDAGLFSPDEVATYQRCERFLWTVRCHLHFLTGRAEERLGFDVQEVMAARLGYQHHRGLRPAERFMKHYFLVARDVGNLTATVCAGLELKQLKSAPVLGRLLNPLTWRQRTRLRRRTEFRLLNGRMALENDDVFKHDPVNIIQLFAEAEKLGVSFHPDALRVVRRSLRLIDDDLRHNARANAIFLDLLTSRVSAEPILRKMNETGVLGRFIPEFGRVVAMMQFNMYHHFTVDEHLLQAVGILSDIDRGLLEEEHPLSSEILPHVLNKRALYVAVFLHDIAKGRDEDHSIAGARVARELCPRLGLTDAETDTVAWLIEHHLLMSETAQSRDLSDPKTIKDFAAIVQSPERLRLLLILTVADIRAVGPGVWNGWKGQLLRTLYYETEPVLAGGHTRESHETQITVAQDALREMAPDLGTDVLERIIERHYPAYWLRTDPERAATDARLLAYADKKSIQFATDYTTDAFTDVTELTILAPNHPNILAVMAGACSAAGANIVGANIYTTRDGMALDSFVLQRAFADDEDEIRRVGRLADGIGKLLRGETYLDQIMPDATEPQGRVSAFTVAPEVLVDNTISDDYTVIEVNGLDRPGLLHDLTSALGKLNLDINSAHISTYGEKVIDVFYVTDLTGKKITDAAREARIHDRLHPILDPERAASTESFAAVV